MGEGAKADVSWASLLPIISPGQERRFSQYPLRHALAAELLGRPQRRTRLGGSASPSFGDSALSPSCGGREQAQSAGAVHGLMAAVDAELGVQVARVGADGVDREEQLTGDLGSRELGRQVAQDADLALAERLAQAPSCARPGRGLPAGQQVQDLGDRDGVSGAQPAVALEQLRRWIKQEQKEQAFWLGEIEGRSSARLAAVASPSASRAIASSKNA